MSPTTPLDPRLRLWRYRVFAATWLCYAGLYFCRKPFYVAKSDLGTALGWDASFLGLLGTVYLVTYTLGQFVAGIAGTMWGPRITLLCGMGLSIASNLVFGWTDSAATFAGFMGLNGLAQATGWGNAVGNMAQWFRRGERGRVMGIWATCFQAGGVMGSGLASLVLGALGFRYSFVVGSGVLLAVMAFFAWAQRDRPGDVGLSLPDEQPASGGAQEGAAPAGRPAAGGDLPRGVRGRFAALGWDRRVVATIGLVGVFYFFVKFIRYALWSWVPFLLSRNYGLEGDDAGYMSTLFDLLGIAGVIALGWISDRLAGGRRIGVSLVFLVGMLCACGLLWWWGRGSIAAFAICLGAIGFFLYGPDALMTGAGAQDIGNARGATLSAATINGMGSIGAVAQELLIGRLYDSQGGATGPIFLLLVGSAAGAAICLALVRITRLSDV